MFESLELGRSTVIYTTSQSDHTDHNQSILKEINPGCSLEGLMLKLKLEYFGQLMQRVDSFEKTLMLGKTEGEGDDRRWDGWMALPTQWTWIWVNSGSWWWTGKPGVLQSMGSQRATELNWTESKLQVRNKELFKSKLFPIILCQYSIKKGYCNIHMS